MMARPLMDFVTDLLRRLVPPASYGRWRRRPGGLLRRFWAAVTGSPLSGVTTSRPAHPGHPHPEHDSRWPDHGPFNPNDHRSPDTGNTLFDDSKDALAPGGYSGSSDFPAYDNDECNTINPATGLPVIPGGVCDIGVNPCESDNSDFDNAHEWPSDSDCEQ